MRAWLSILPFCLLLAWAAARSSADDSAPADPSARRWSEARKTAAEIDRRLSAHWQALGIEPAEPADDLALLRRATLDLAGRIPAPSELEWIANAPADRRGETIIKRLIDGPEFALHLGRVLDQWVQQRHAGDDAFVGWLRASVEQRRGWNDIFRRVLIGPWDGESEQAASRFLTKRIKSLDSMTTDATTAFFGVDITCARCHDHPLVEDWTQHHYYGMAAFFGRTIEVKKNSGQIGEKPDGEVTFEARDGGKQQTAALMFLAGGKAASEPKQNRREQLVRLALDERQMLSHAAVNRLWAWFFGRGLVHPVDQMHSANPPSVPGLLEWLADDFAAHDFEIQHLASAITLSRAYQLSSRQVRSSSPPPEETFAVARLRPLTRHQFAIAALLATGSAVAMPGEDRDAVKAAYLEREKQAVGLLAGLDPTADRYQASAAEALFLANHAVVQKLAAPADENLAARLAKCSGDLQRTELAYRTVLCRNPTSDEAADLGRWWREQPNAESAAAQLVWALVTSSEFRFNH